MVRPIIAGNWKMNKTVAESVDFAERLRSAYQTPPDREVIIAPPFTALQVRGGGHPGILHPPVRPESA